MAATTASILERTAVAAADAKNVDLDAIANKLASAARRVRVLEKRRAKTARAAFAAAARKRRRPPPTRRPAPAPPSYAPKTLPEALAAPPPGNTASTAPPPADAPAALAVMAQARRAEIQHATEAVRAARAAPREPQPSQSFTSLVGDFLRPMVAAVADDAAPDEPGGWLDVALGGGWERRWCAVVSGPHGPRLEIGKSPGAPPDDVALLVGCEVEASEDESDRFAFRVVHAHQRTRVLAARNKDTRRQWTSTLSGAARTHASKAREQDLAAPAARRRLLAAERRLGVAVERGRVEGGG
jgi:hypothetical protein